jgi:SSS family solute:Na+ symporter
MDHSTAVIILVYLVVATAIGSAMARRATSASGWAVAGGGMTTSMVAFGIAGTRIGGAGTYGVAGDVINGGVWNLWWYGICTFVAFAVVGIFFAVHYRRMKLHTVGELFTIRWGTRRCQWLTSLCVQTEYGVVNLIEAYVIGVILSTLTPLPMIAGVLIAAVIFSTYVSLGGLWGTAVTNMIHCTVILVGLLTVGVMGIGQLGGWSAVTATVNAHLAAAGRSESEWWSFIGMGWLPVFAMFFSAAVHTPAASIYTNYATAAKSERYIAPAFLLGGIIGGIMPMLAGLIGILTTARYGLDAGLSGYRNLTTLASEISPLVGGIALAAVLAAVISSGGPILLSSATMFVRDWLPFTRHYSSERQLRAYQITTTAYAFLAAFAAWVVATQTNISILDLLLFGFAMVVPPAVSVGYLIYARGTSEKGAYWGMLLGYCGGLVWFALIKIALVSGFGAPESAGAVRQLLAYGLTVNGEGLDPSYVTTLVPLVAVPLISRLRPDTGDSLARRDEFYAMLSGEKRVEQELV